MNNPLGIREPHEVNKTSFDLGGNRTHDLRIRSTVTLPTELRGRTENVGDDFVFIVLRGTTFIFTKDSVKNIQNLCFDFDLVDIWRIRNPERRRFTWRQKSPFIQRRLDYCLISDVCQDEIEKSDIIPSINSDHSAIFLQFNSIEIRPWSLLLEIQRQSGGRRRFCHTDK